MRIWLGGAASVCSPRELVPQATHRIAAVDLVLLLHQYHMHAEAFHRLAVSSTAPPHAVFRSSSICARSHWRATSYHQSRYAPTSRVLPFDTTAALAQIIHSSFPDAAAGSLRCCPDRPPDSETSRLSYVACSMRRELDCPIA